MSKYLIIAGAQKAATTTLFHVLAGNPAISPARTKEPNYHAARVLVDYAGPGDDALTSRVVRDWEHYQALWPESGADCWRMEASTLYLPFTAAHESLGRLPDVAVIVVLRDPLERAFSAYKHMRRDGRESATFLRALQEEDDRRDRGWSPSFWYAQLSDYVGNLRSLDRHVGGERLRVIPYKALVERPGEVLADLAEFLDINPVTVGELPRHNPSGKVRNQVAGRLLFGDVAWRSRVRQYMPGRLHDWVVRARGWLVEHEPIPADASALLVDRGLLEQSATLKAMFGDSICEGWPPVGAAS